MFPLADAASAGTTAWLMQPAALADATSAVKLLYDFKGFTPASNYHNIQ